MKLYRLLHKLRNTNQKSTPPKILGVAVKKVMRLGKVILLLMIVLPIQKAYQVMREMTRIVMDLAVSPLMKTQEQDLGQ